MNIDETILDLIGNEPIATQTRLRKLLAERGFDVTQPTLSRHLKRLSIQKRSGSYRRVERAAMDAPDRDVKLAPPNMIVYRTPPGHAQLLAVLLDSNDIEGVAGTLAGDDVVFIAAGDPDLDAVVTRIEAILTRD